MEFRPSSASRAKARYSTQRTSFFAGSGLQDIQTLTFSNSTATTFTISFNGLTTGLIPYSTTAATTAASSSQRAAATQMPPPPNSQLRNGKPDNAFQALDLRCAE